MKKTALLAPFFIIMLGALALSARGDEGKGALYGQRIVTETNADKIVHAAGDELAAWLKQMTGKTFETNNAPADGAKSAIFLVGVQSPLVAAADRARLAGKGREAFLVRSEKGNKLWIIGNSSLAVRHGVYYYLDQLGCRWFFPNEHWTIIPARPAIGLTIDRVEAPSYRGREFGGTGGYGGSLAIDPERKLQARWEKWQERNFFGGDAIPGGHTGQAFNTIRKKELLAHPEYMAETGGKRQPYEDNREDVMFCIANPGLRQLYIDWILEQFKDGESNPNLWAVSVEPSDGNGQCDCAKCLKIGDGSPTDRIFFMANEVAKAVAVKYPGKKVSLLAYNEHAAAPSFPLEPNIFVYVTPYGFNRTGQTPEDLIRAWGKKANELGIYDYWSIPDWANCLPGLDFRGLVPDRLRFWHKNSVRGFMSESSYSAGNVGIAWYVASRVMWNLDADVPALLEDFYAKSFGPAAPPMRRMVERWCGYGDNFLLSGHELGLSFRDLQQARRLTTDPAILARINDFVLYVQYIRLWHEYQQTVQTGALPASADKPKAEGQEPRPKDSLLAADALVTFCWRIYDSTMVHSYRMHMLIQHRYEKQMKWFDDKWPLYTAAESWKKSKPLTDEEIDRLVEDGVRIFQPLEFEPRSYSDAIVPLMPAGKSGTDWVQSPSLACDQECLFWAAPDVKKVEIQFSCGAPRTTAARSPNDRVIITDPKGRTVFEKVIESDGAWNSLAIPTPTTGLYRMKVYDQKSMFFLKVPSTLPFVLKGGFLSADVCPKVYFYVPKGLKRFSFYAEGVIPFPVFDPDERKLDTPVNGMVALDVPAGMDGRVWSFSGFKSWAPFRALNIPSLFAFSPQGIMVPAEVIPQPNP